MSELKKIKKYGLEKYRIQAFWATIFILLDVIVGFSIPFVSDKVMSKYIPAQDWNMVWILCALMGVISIVGLISLFLNAYFSQKAAQFGAADLRYKLFEKITKLSFKNIDEFKQGRLVTTVTNDITQVQGYYGMIYTMFLRAPFYFIGGITFALISSPRLTLVYAITMPILILSIIIIAKVAIPYFSKMQKDLDEINTIAMDNVNAPRVFKTFRTESYEAEKFSKVNTNYRNNAVKAITRMGLFMPISGLIADLGTVILITLGGYFIKEGIIPNSAAPFLTFNAYSMRILVGVMMFAMIFMSLSRAIVSAKRILEVMECQVDLENSEDAIKDFELKGEIEFKNVSFSYSGESEVVKGINLKINAGEKVGIIGSTGSGKSTFVKLIPRLYDVTNGELLLDGKNIKDYDVEVLRKQVSMATQEAVIFKGTIRTNIMQGLETASQEEIEKSAEISCAKEYIEQKDNTYDSEVTERGTNLSGGQKQRLSLARALVRRPAILILDDVTSALDSKSEQQVRSNLKEIGESMTTIIISQKISSIMDMDKIIVLDSYGRVDGFAKHDELLETSVIYQELYESQFGGAK